MPATMLWMRQGSPASHFSASQTSATRTTKTTQPRDRGGDVGVPVAGGAADRAAASVVAVTDQPVTA